MFLLCANIRHLKIKYSQINSDIPDFIIVENIEITSFTVTGNGAAERKISAAKQGYKPIGVVGWYITGTRASYVTIPNLYLSGDQINSYYRNTGSVNATISGYYQVLYKKSP